MAEYRMIVLFSMSVQLSIVSSKYVWAYKKKLKLVWQRHGRRIRNRKFIHTCLYILVGYTKCIALLDEKKTFQMLLQAKCMHWPWPWRLISSFFISISRSELAANSLSIPMLEYTYISSEILHIHLITQAKQLDTFRIVCFNSYFPLDFSITFFFRFLWMQIQWKKKYVDLFDLFWNCCRYAEHGCRIAYCWNKKYPNATAIPMSHLFHKYNRGWARRDVPDHGQQWPCPIPY